MFSAHAKKRSLLALMLCVSCLTMLAIPASRKPFVGKLTDGRTVSVQLCGDEVMHYYQTTGGQRLERLDDGTFRLAADAGSHRLAQCKAQYDSRRKANDARRAQRLTASREVSTYTGSRKGLVLLVSFKDVPMTYSREDFNDMFNQVGYKRHGSMGSVHDYFLAQSYNQFDLTFDVAGPYTPSKNLAYYGANDSRGNDAHIGEMLAEVLRLANPDVNYADYDWDGDGVVDQVYVIYAGYSEASSAPDYTIWPHEWDLQSSDYGKALQLDGVYLNTYACSSELEGNRGSTMDGIGTACHEFSHCLGLPDIYDTKGYNFGMDAWSVMDSGNYNGDSNIPAGYTSYERMATGWLKPVELTDPCVVSGMKPLASEPEAYIIYNDAHRDEYYLLENRQLTGWDSGLSGHGLLITHVDYDASVWEDNELNVVKGHCRLTIIPADNQFASYDYSLYTASASDLAGDPFPGTRHNTALTDTSTPNFNLYNLSPYGDKLLRKPIENISEQDGLIGFTFMGGDPDALRAPLATAATSISADGFTAHWHPIPSAESYTLEVTWDDHSKTFEGIADTTFTVSGIRPESQWRYRVCAVAGGKASEWSNSITVIPRHDDIWTTWEPFAAGTGYYSYDSYAFLDESYNCDLPVEYRQSLADTSVAQIRLHDWCLGQELIIDWDKAGNRCSVSQQYTGYEDDYYGRVYVADGLTYHTQVLKTNGIDYGQYPSAYDPETGKLTLYLFYYDLVDPADIWGEGIETLQMKGDGFKQYHLTIALGDLTDMGDGTGRQTFMLMPDADVASCRYALVKGELEVEGTLDENIQAVIHDAIPSTTVTDFTQPLNVTFTSGKYTLIAVSYDAEGHDRESDYAFFHFESALDWQPIGMARYTDDVLCSLYGLAPITYDVEVEENLVTPGIYRMKNPYGPDYLYNESDECLPGDYYIEINAHDPNRVFIEYQPMGVDWGDGPCYIYSLAMYYVELGYDMDFAAEAGVCGTLRNGIITFPANALCVALGDDLYYANPSQQFRLDLTTCGLTPIHNDDLTGADAPLHDLCGRRVDAPAPGIYLRQGKKILVRP